MVAAVLNQPQFQDPDMARDYLEALRWPHGPICPHCGNATHDRIYKVTPNTDKKVRKGLYKCRECKQQFTVTVGTLFADSKVPLNKWLQAAYLMASSKTGISAKQLERMLGVTYKTAWFMAHRVRAAMTDDGVALLGQDGGAAEVDEAYWGGNIGKQRRGVRGWAHKMKSRLAGRARRQEALGLRCQRKP